MLGQKVFGCQIVVPMTLNLHGLHMVTQATFNWEGYQAYDFAKGKQKYSSEEFVREYPEYGYKMTTQTGLYKLFKKKGDTIDYFHDLGDV